MADLLIELFSEEIPARMQKQASADLERMITSALKDAGLSFETSAAYATPRRLALSVTGLPLQTADVSEERRGPSTSAPEKALEGFLRGAGVTREQCEERTEKKGTFLYAIIEKKGIAAENIIAEALTHTIKHFPWAKSQRWGTCALKWVRPLHSILCLFDGKVVDMDVDGFKASNTTKGHRFMAPEAFEVTGFDDYKQKLHDHKVMLDPAERMAVIEQGARKLAQDEGLEWVEDRGLLEEVAGLVEWPVPLMAGFDPSFMEVPEEVLIKTMKKDQKYFVLRDPKTGKLAPKFITTSNIVASDGGKVVAAGNEKVLSARLADAKFFWEQDLKIKLDDRLPDLADIIFHIKLGTVADRVERMKALASYLSDSIDGCDKAQATIAAELAKADLVSLMVGEFADLQGVMGRYYALAQNETPEVADAIRDHYAPQGPNDACPTAPVSVAVALAEKIDTLVGFFGIDQKPTGSKDPYALRRAALGIIRLITENGLRVSITALSKTAVEGYFNFSGSRADVKEHLMEAEHWTYVDKYLIDPKTGRDVILDFIIDRLKVQQKEKGTRHDLIDAVFALGDDDLTRVLARVGALTHFLKSDDGENLHAGYKRARNILAKAKEDTFGDANEELLSEVQEKALFDALSSSAPKVDAALDAEKFEDAMSVLADLRAPIDAFFDNVMVNADDDNLRKNRMAMLEGFVNTVNRVADFSLIEG